MKDFGIICANEGELQAALYILYQKGFKYHGKVETVEKAFNDFGNYGRIFISYRSKTIIGTCQFNTPAWEENLKNPEPHYHRFPALMQLLENEGEFVKPPKRLDLLIHGSPVLVSQDQVRIGCVTVPRKDVETIANEMGITTIPFNGGYIRLVSHSHDIRLVECRETGEVEWAVLSLRAEDGITRSVGYRGDLFPYHENDGKVLINL